MHNCWQLLPLPSFKHSLKSVAEGKVDCSLQSVTHSLNSHSSSAQPSFLSISTSSHAGNLNLLPPSTSYFTFSSQPTTLYLFFLLSLTLTLHTCSTLVNSLYTYLCTLTHLQCSLRDRDHRWPPHQVPGHLYKPHPQSKLAPGNHRCLFYSSVLHSLNDFFLTV